MRKPNRDLRWLDSTEKVPSPAKPRGRASNPPDRRIFLAALCMLFLGLFLGGMAAPAYSLTPETTRQVHCLIFVDGARGLEERVQSLIDDVNDYLQKERVDVVLTPCGPFKAIEFTGDTAKAMLEELREAAAGSTARWHLVLAFTTAPLRGPNGQNWSGAIEKKESRHIIIKCLNRNTVLHEIGHALGLPHGTGVMLPTLKTGYVGLEPEYVDALRKMTLAWAADPGPRRYAAIRGAARPGSRVLTYAQTAALRSE